MPGHEPQQEQGCWSCFAGLFAGNQYQSLASQSGPGYGTTSPSINVARHSIVHATTSQIPPVPKSKPPTKNRPKPNDSSENEVKGEYLSSNNKITALAQKMRADSIAFVNKFVVIYQVAPGDAVKFYHAMLHQQDFLFNTREFFEEYKQEDLIYQKLQRAGLTQASGYFVRGEALNVNAGYYANIRNRKAKPVQWKVNVFRFRSDEIACDLFDLSCYAKPDIKNSQLLFAQILDAIAVLHNVKVIHRDIKPENILLTVNGRVKLIDFGISDILDDGNEQSRVKYKGTRDYQPPKHSLTNQLYRERPWTIDVWSFAAMLAEYFFGVKTLDWFENKGFPGIAADIKSAQIDKEYQQLANAEPDVKNLLDSVRSLIATIVVPHKKRPPIEILKQHDFFKGINWADIRSGKPKLLQQLKPDLTRAANSRQQYLKQSFGKDKEALAKALPNLSFAAPRPKK